MTSAAEESASAAVLGKLVYTPKNVEETRIDQFRQTISKKYQIDLPDYDAFWKWSCDHASEFWTECWEEVKIIASKSVKEALPSHKIPNIYPPPKWFEGSRLNFAENLLRHSQSNSPLLDQPALIQAAEADPSKPDSFHQTVTTQRQLRLQVAQAVRALRARGIIAGDRIASYSSNCSANVVAFLASAAIGAIWVSSAADFAPQGVLERLKTVRPKVLFAVDGVRYNGRVHDHLNKLEEIVKGLEDGIEKEEQKLQEVIVIPYLNQIGSQSDSAKHQHTNWDDFLQSGKGTSEDDSNIEFEQLDFNHPLWILFSSGTTGKPKAIMHRSGGMLIQMAKELLLHGNMTPKDTFFYYTTPGWMMWNWLVGGLLTGAPLVLFDGSPLKPASTLWTLSSQLGITIFGTSAAYLSALEKTGFKPRETFPNLKVKQVLSTGSPLRADLYPWIMENVGPETLIGSITGGTDICSLFAGHNVALPVYAGEIQGRNLGMNVDVFDDAGNSILPGKGSGDLVCKTAFPAQPLSFFSQSEERHFDTYYSQFKGVWYHGDYVGLSTHGGLVMLGRSDGVLNPGGIRFGSSEIYDALEKDKMSGNLQQVENWLVCSLKTPSGDDEVVVLFLILKEGKNSLKADQLNTLESHIKSLIRQKRSARHVPKYIRIIEGVPLTLNGKLAEIPAKKLINGAPLSTINSATLQNPEILQSYVEAGKELREALANGK